MPDQDDSWGYWQTGVQQAYRLYTLALAGAPEQGAMNRMKEQANLPLQAKWRLAAAYALTGKMKPAEELVFKAETIQEFGRRELVQYTVHCFLIDGDGTSG